MTNTQSVISVTIFAAIAVSGLLLLRPAACRAARQNGSTRPARAPAPVPLATASAARPERAVFGAGCFWGVEAIFRSIDGVVSTRVGYSGGLTVNPTYQDVCSHGTGHAEAVEVFFDPARVSYDRLLQIFWASHDPSAAYSGGPDIGDQYRSVIFTTTPLQAAVARLSRVREQTRHDRAITTEILPAAPFYAAEEYHQQYFEKAGGGACHRPTNAPDSPMVPAGADATKTYWSAVTDAEWRGALTPEQYRIARAAGTERAFTGAYRDLHDSGSFHCAACGQNLFLSHTKFESGTGWPSFWQPITGEAVATNVDSDLGMVRTEVVCSRCGAHLGHVFDDGPAPTGLRYCINSGVLDFVPEPKSTEE